MTRVASRDLYPRAIRHRRLQGARVGEVDSISSYRNGVAVTSDRPVKEVHRGVSMEFPTKWWRSIRRRFWARQLAVLGTALLMDGLAPCRAVIRCGYLGVDV